MHTRVKNSHISFEDNSSMIFYSNTVVNGGGSIYSINSNIPFEDSSSTIFENNIADYSGAISIYYNNGILLQHLVITQPIIMERFTLVIITIFHLKIILLQH